MFASHALAACLAELRSSVRRVRTFVFVAVAAAGIVATLVLASQATSAVAPLAGAYAPRFVLSVVGNAWLWLFLVATVFLAFDARQQDERARRGRGSGCEADVQPGAAHGAFGRNGTDRMAGPGSHRGAGPGDWHRRSHGPRGQRRRDDDARVVACGRRRADLACDAVDRRCRAGARIRWSAGAVRGDGGAAAYRDRPRGTRARRSAYLCGGHRADVPVACRVVGHGLCKLRLGRSTDGPRTRRSWHNERCWCCSRWPSCSRRRRCIPATTVVLGRDAG